MKIAPVINAIRQHNGASEEPIRHVLVHTGQHYDELMSGAFFADLNLPAPDIHLGVGSGTHAGQTAEIMAKFESVLLEQLPDVVVVVGDVNSTMACALVASKISFGDSGKRPVIAHVEAGLRSFDRTMPEEINRIITDHLSDLLFVTEESGVRNLAREGVPKHKIFLVGNTMIDSLIAYKEKSEESAVLDNLDLRSPEDNGCGQSIAHYALLTLHRPANVDTRANFLNILQGLEELSRECPVIFPAHPRTQRRIREFGFDDYFESQSMPRRASGDMNRNGRKGSIRLVNPLGYLDFLCLMTHARLVITDSGGIQEETTCLGVPCVTVRENTERPVTLKSGTNVLAGVQKQGIQEMVRRQLKKTFANEAPQKWDGKAALRIFDILLSSKNLSGVAN